MDSFFRWTTMPFHACRKQETGGRKPGILYEVTNLSRQAQHPVWDSPLRGTFCPYGGTMTLAQYLYMENGRLSFCSLFAGFENKTSDFCVMC